MHQGEKETLLTDLSLRFKRKKRPMMVSNLKGPRFEVKKFDGQNDYILW